MRFIAIGSFAGFAGTIGRRCGTYQHQVRNGRVAPGHLPSASATHGERLLKPAHDP